MKLFKYLPFALAIAAMVGCSDDSFVDNGSENDVLEDGGTLSINVQLPSINTRAITDEDIDNGNEYAINDGTIVLYDANKNFIMEYKLSSADIESFNDNESNDITQSSTTIQIAKNSQTPKYLLVLLNVPTEVSTTFDLNKSNYNSFKEAVVTIQSSADGIKTVGTPGTSYFFMSKSTFDNTQWTNLSTVYHSTNGIQDRKSVV